MTHDVEDLSNELDRLFLVPDPVDVLADLFCELVIASGGASTSDATVSSVSVGPISSLDGVSANVASANVSPSSSFDVALQSLYRGQSVGPSPNAIEKVRRRLFADSSESDSDAENNSGKGDADDDRE